MEICGIPKLLDETLGLGALARSGRAHENDAHVKFLTCDLPPSKGRHSTQTPTLQIRRDKRRRDISRDKRETHMSKRPSAKKPKPMNAFYAQSGGVSAVINASAAGVIEAAMKSKTDRQGVRRSARHRRGAHRGPHRRQQGIARHHQGTQVHARGCIRVRALQAQEPRAGSRQVRAPHRGLQGARHRLLLLQRRQRFHGHG